MRIPKQTQPRASVDLALAGFLCIDAETGQVGRLQRYADTLYRLNVINTDPNKVGLFGLPRRDRVKLAVLWFSKLVDEGNLVFLPEDLRRMISSVHDPR
jgi:hypothetical protein